MNLETAKRKAQAAADNEGKRIAVINLNPFSPLYVLRFVPDSMPGEDLKKDRDIAFLAHPKKE